MDINQLLQLTSDKNASDLHLIAGVPPHLRVEGILFPIPGEIVFTPEDTEKVIQAVLTAPQLERFKTDREIDFSYAFNEKSRFRVNAYTQKGSSALAFRRIPLTVPELAPLGLPKVVNSFVELKQGFVLVTGPTGHGKSTALAAILNEINKTRAEHIITVEDPVEFLLRPIKSIISQREVEGDTRSWAAALKSILREDPNVVLVGEMRDYETMSAAMTIAETGHLVFATLHTNSAAQTIDRIVDVFPEEQQGQVRLQLSNVIEAVVSMRLVPAISGKRVVASEVMLGSAAIKTTIREGKSHQIDNIIQTSKEVGMNSLEMSLADLVSAGVITLDTAKSYSIRPEDLARLIRKV